MASVIIRILLRYMSAALIAKGFLSPDLGGFITTDPDVVSAIEVGVGLSVGLIAEGWYVLARRFGWSK